MGVVVRQPGEIMVVRGDHVSRRLSYEDLEQEPPELDGWRPALPSTCLRRLTSLRPGDCDVYCEGRQRDGGCLCDLVRRANDAGVEWSFEIDRDGVWNYVGDELPSDEDVRIAR